MRNLILSSLLLTLCLAAPLGCGSSDSGDSVVGALDTSASSDAAATADAADVAVAAPRTECDAERPCAGGRLCDCDGNCVDDPGTEECTEDRNCGPNRYCAPCLLRCMDQGDVCDPCSDHGQCRKNGTRCLLFSSGDSFCGRACEADPGCPAGYSCQQVGEIPSKQCVPRSGSCEAPGLCQQNSDCPELHYCNTEVGLCAQGCADDDECATGQVCSALRCQPPCDDDTNPCEGGMVCDEGHCRPEGDCFAPADCPLPETYCDLEQRLCLEGCQTDFDCKQSKKICQDGACVDKPCPGNYWCAFGQICDPQTGGCKAAEGPFCAECTSGGDQADMERQCGAGGLCLDFQDEDGNTEGSFCAPACGSDPANPCPKGYQCQEVTDQDGNPVGNVCARDCTYDPIGGAP